MTSETPVFPSAVDERAAIEQLIDEALAAGCSPTQFAQHRRDAALGSPATRSATPRARTPSSSARTAEWPNAQSLSRMTGIRSAGCRRTATSSSTSPGTSHGFRA